MTAPILRVRIVRDTASPLWAIKCADACGSCKGEHIQPSMCWLSSAFTKGGAERIAAAKGWQVVA